jgi:hypothetical protein
MQMVGASKKKTGCMRCHALLDGRTVVTVVTVSLMVHP